ncbi:N-acetylmuramoyl-L-alanine amidase [Carnobacterium jeotgali]|uniref:N-acetylmuramoyl-L-alanine amidase n=1 Tax=Carnobacterium jeotgali TaxID=545534 RepID=UPI00388DD81F
MTFLLIDGHGENKNGSFDPGATGIIKKGEHKYFEENFFPAVKKHLPKNSDVVLFSQYNVYDYKNLVTLADKYGKNTVVIEMHYDAGSSSASGGHVIVHSAYAPDKYDLAIRDVIKKHIGIRYEHKGQKGISGRDNLGNCNRAKSAGLNYRLVELGFGTNAKDAKVMVDNVDDIAKDFVRALLGEVLDSVPTEPVKAPTPKPVAKPVTKPAPVKSIQQLVDETKAGKHGNGEARKKALGANYNAVMDIINGGSKTAPVAKKKSVYLPKSAKTWRVYKTSGPYTTGKEVGFLAPAQYGGLNYEIIKTLATDVYQIKTSTFGNVAIYAAKSTGATIK